MYNWTLYCLGVLRKEHKSKHLSRMPSFLDHRCSHGGPVFTKDYPDYPN